MIILRLATAADQQRIVQLIREAEINPMSLKWPNFLLAIDDATQEIVGTGQIKTHGDGSRELASIATTPAYQKRGIAKQIIQHLLEHSTGVLYLTCVKRMGTFYEPFGFRSIEEDEMTPYFRRLKKIAGVFTFFAPVDKKLLVMKRDG